MADSNSYPAHRRELWKLQAKALQLRAQMVGNGLLKERLLAESNLAALHAGQGATLAQAWQEVAHG